MVNIIKLLLFITKYSFTILSFNILSNMFINKQLYAIYKVLQS